MSSSRREFLYGIGSLGAMALAEVVLGRDPFKVDPLELVNIPIQRAMVGGKPVFEA